MSIAKSALSDSREETIEMVEAGIIENVHVDEDHVGSLDSFSRQASKIQEDNISVRQNKSPETAAMMEHEGCQANETMNLIHHPSNLYSYHTSQDTIDERATTIASRIGKRNKLMQDDPISELLRLEMIRDMPHNLTLKRSVKAKVTSSINLNARRKSISYWKKLSYQASMTISKMKAALKQCGSHFELWRYPIKNIEGHFGSGIATYFKFLRWLFLTNTIICLVSLLFVTIPQALVRSHIPAGFSSWDLFLGNGILANSILYYGFYENDTVTISSNFSYDMPSAYFVTFVFCYIFILILLCSKVAKTYKKCYIETSGGAYNRYANKIFCSWDWGISSSKAASLRSASIYTELEELLWDARNPPSPASCSMKIWTLLIRVAMTSLIFSILWGTGALLWLLLLERRFKEPNSPSVIIVPLVMTLIVNLIPPLISWSVKFERYSRPRVSFYVALVRMYALALTTILPLLLFWLSREGCWQTGLAQDVYRLLLLDLVIGVLGSLILQAFRVCLAPANSRPSFDLACNSLGLLYHQGLLWLALYLGPGLSLLGLIKLLLTFHAKRLELAYFCEIPARFWRAAHTHTLLLALAFLAMSGALGFLGYAIAWADSSACGPYAGDGGTDSYSKRTIERIAQRLLPQGWHSPVWDAVANVVSSPATGIAVVIAMCVAVYYLKAKAEASKQMVRILREMLVWQARDKEFLLKTFSTANDENWLRHRQQGKFLKEPQRNNLTDRSVHEASTSY
ncbi:hypothetical protein QAD02_005935 [Eretmocerus hayati]|uniref:Uncharacterized protein n=1 Tax=Eretmocerus hayati TaxID=131215 RepID=A0ACC2N022_9HYME|nr:hypothetical protein QAD02_005935 [Eretmocerus hayati]